MKLHTDLTSMQSSIWIYSETFVNIDKFAVIQNTQEL